MIPENVDRNFLIYELWREGKTIDEISFETGIPRSSVGYYVRKFNKLAKRGEPIAFQPMREKEDEKTLAIQGGMKHLTRVLTLKNISEGKIDRVYKVLMICKLMKELQGDLFPTEEERKACRKNLSFVLTEVWMPLVSLL